MLLEGVRIGPMDPDSTADFGTVGAKNSARTLIRRHAAMHPPQLTGVLRRKRQAERSDALDMGEVRRAAEQRIEDEGQEVPEDFYITGAAVRGEDDAPSQQVVSFTYALPSGRQGKGALPYNSDTVPESIAAGDEAVRVADAKKRGVAWVPQQIADAFANAGAKPADEDDESIDAVLAKQQVEGERDEAVQRAERAEREKGELEQRLDALSAQVAQLEAARTGEPASTGETPRPALPFEDFEGKSADAIKERLGAAEGAEQVALAQSVLAYERGPDGSNRSTVVKAANSILDRPANAG